MADTGLSRRLTVAVEEWAAECCRRPRESAARTLERAIDGRIEGGKPGTTYRAIVSYMTGQSEPSLEWLRVVGRVVGVHPAWIAFGVEPGGAGKQVAERLRALADEVDHD